MWSFLVAKRISKQQSSKVSATRDWLSLDTKSETDWDCSHSTYVGRDDQAPDCVHCYFRLHLLAGSCHWVSGVVCAAPVTTDTAGRFQSRICLHLTCILGPPCHELLLHLIFSKDHPILFPPSHALFCTECLIVDAQILKADMWRECPRGWASFSERCGRELGGGELIDLLLWIAGVENVFVDWLQQSLLPFL